MARRSLQDLLAEDAEEPAVPAPPPPAPARELRNRATPELPDSGSSEVPKSGSTEVRESGTSERAPGAALAHRTRPPRAKKKPAPAAPKWTTLERKDTLLWKEQIDGLTELRRDLQRRKREAGGGGERITENTLIRVAVAALLEHGDALTGKDESELRNSLSSVLRNSRTSEVRK